MSDYDADKRKRYYGKKKNALRIVELHLEVFPLGYSNVVSRIHDFFSYFSYLSIDNFLVRSRPFFEAGILLHKFFILSEILPKHRGLHGTRNNIEIRQIIFKGFLRLAYQINIIQIIGFLFVQEKFFLKVSDFECGVKKLGDGFAEKDFFLKKPEFHE